MQNIEFPDDKFQKLTVAVQAAGYSDIYAFLNAVADEPTEDPRGELTDEELRESVEMIKRGNAEIEAGGGMDADEAFQRIADKHGITLPQSR